MARALLAAGANANQRDDDGTSVLHWAVFGARPDEIHVYLELDRPHDTVFRPQPAAPISVQLLIERGRAGQRRRSGRQHGTARGSDARREGRCACADRAGANRTLRNREGKTAYDLAKDRNNSVLDVLKP